MEAHGEKLHGVRMLRGFLNLLLEDIPCPLTDFEVHSTDCAQIHREFSEYLVTAIHLPLVALPFCSLDLLLGVPAQLLKLLVDAYLGTGRCIRRIVAAHLVALRGGFAARI